MAEPWLDQLRQRLRSGVPGPLLVEADEHGVPVGVSEYAIITRLVGYIGAQTWDADCDRLPGLEAQVSRLQHEVVELRDARAAEERRRIDLEHEAVRFRSLLVTALPLHLRSGLDDDLVQRIREALSSRPAGGVP